MKDINLLPDDIKASAEPFKAEKTNASPVKLITIIVASVVLIAATFVLPKFVLITMNARLDSINKSIESATYNEVRLLKSKTVQEAGKIEAKNSIISVIEKDSSPMSQVMAIIKNSIPQGCTLERVNFENNELIVEGKATGSIKAAELLTNIRRISSITVKTTSVSDKNGIVGFKYNFYYGGKAG